MVQTSRIRRSLNRIAGRLSAGSTVIVVVLACICAGALFWQVDVLRIKLIESTSLSHAQLYSDAITTFRSLYTSEVVARAKSTGIDVVHNYEEIDGAIPLPATLSMRVASSIGKLSGDTRVQLYSPYPFPWRSELGGLRTDFSRQAWEYLQKDPEGSFYRFEEIGGASFLLFATADRMREACIGCHNTHPDTPKTGWKVGDLRGVLEIALPLEGAIEATESNLRDTNLLAGAMLLLTIAGIALTARKFRAINASLTGRSDELQALNRELDNKVEERTVNLRREVRERLHAERKSSASKARYVAAIELMHDAHIIIDDDGLIQSFNCAAEKIFCYQRAEVIGHNVDMLMPEPHQHAHDDYLDRYRKTGEARILGKTLGAARDMRLFGLRKDGSTFPLSLLVEKFETSEGVFFSGILRDISQALAIEADNKHLAAAVEQASDSIIVTNSDRVIEYVNPQFEREFGYCAEAVVGMNSKDVSWGLSSEQTYDELRETMRRGKVWSGHLRSKTKDGVMIEHDVTVSPISDQTGNITHYVQIRRNVTDRLQLEQQLRQAQKLESIGQLAAGIAHEINTPIQYVGDNTRFVKDAFDDISVLFDTLTKLLASANGSVSTQRLADALARADVEYLTKEVPRALEQSLEGVERVAKIVRAMKEFSHPAQEKTLVDLNAAIQSTLTVATNEWKYVAELNTDFDPALPPVSCLPGEFNQVILNIIVNASHAIIDVLGDAPAEKGEIIVTTRKRPEWAEIRITDNGSGMPEEVRARVFDPFYTTKEVGKGTGQGLSLAYTVIVEKHGGTITVDSEVGRGTSFTIRLPLEELASVEASVAASGKSER